MPAHVPKVYFIRIGKCIKIGVSTNLKKRLKTFEGSSAENITLIACFDGSFRHEKLLHDIFKEYRVRNEFFRIDWFIMEFLEKAQQISIQYAIKWARDYQESVARERRKTPVQRKWEADRRWREIVAKRKRDRDARLPKRRTKIDPTAPLKPIPGLGESNTPKNVNEINIEF